MYASASGLVRAAPRAARFKKQAGDRSKGEAAGAPALHSLSSSTPRAPGRPPRILSAWRLCRGALPARCNGDIEPITAAENSAAMLPTSAAWPHFCNTLFPGIPPSIFNYRAAMVLTDPAGTSICPHLNVGGGITDKNRNRPGPDPNRNASASVRSSIWGQEGRFRAMGATNRSILRLE